MLLPYSLHDSCRIVKSNGRAHLAAIHECLLVLASKTCKSRIAGTNIHSYELTGMHNLHNLLPCRVISIIKLDPPATKLST